MNVNLSSLVVKNVLIISDRVSTVYRKLKYLPLYGQEENAVYLPDTRGLHGLTCKPLFQKDKAGHETVLSKPELLILVLIGPKY